MPEHVGGVDDEVLGPGRHLRHVAAPQPLPEPLVGAPHCPPALQGAPQAAEELDLVGVVLGLGGREGEGTVSGSGRLQLVQSSTLLGSCLGCGDEKGGGG